MDELNDIPFEQLITAVDNMQAYGDEIEHNGITLVFEWEEEDMFSSESDVLNFYVLNSQVVPPEIIFAKDGYSNEEAFRAEALQMFLLALICKKGIKGLK